MVFRLTLKAFLIEGLFLPANNIFWGNTIKGTGRFRLHCRLCGNAHKTTPVRMYCTIQTVNRQGLPFSKRRGNGSLPLTGETGGNPLKP